ncbi:MAG TPA: F0F1 ATP synthase subunit B [Nitriliruptoraceae bacterium]|nr:F0F1 ATP synthase subunit B [Nitriliruptoraceae bacterium]
MNVLLLATEAGEEAGGITLLLPEAPEMVYGLIGFLIVFFVMKRFAFPGMNKMLEDRTAAIQGKMEDAEQMRSEAETAKREYEASIADAKGEAARIRDAAKADAERIRADLVKSAEADAAAIRERAQADAAQERERTLQELRGDVGRMSVELASRIVEKEVDPATHQALVDSYINNLSGPN